MQRDLAFSHYRAAATALVLSSFFPLIPPQALLNCMRLVASLFLKTSFFFCVGLVLGRSHRDLLFRFWSCLLLVSSGVAVYVHTCTRSSITKKEWPHRRHLRQEGFWCLCGSAQEEEKSSVARMTARRKHELNSYQRWTGSAFIRNWVSTTSTTTTSFMQQSRCKLYMRQQSNQRWKRYRVSLYFVSSLQYTRWCSVVAKP